MSSNPPRSAASRNRKPSKAPNKSQLRAAEVRARQTHESVRQQVPVKAEAPVSTATAERLVSPAPVADSQSIVERQRSGVRVNASGKARGKATRSALTVHKLTREQEYTFIKADLRRLLITAGSLAVVMIVLLFVIEQ